MAITSMSPSRSFPPPTCPTSCLFFLSHQKANKAKKNQNKKLKEKTHKKHIYMNNIYNTQNWKA